MPVPPKDTHVSHPLGDLADSVAKPEYRILSTCDTWRSKGPTMSDGTPGKAQRLQSVPTTALFRNFVAVSVEPT
jgi:hypothetical protein